MLQSKGNREAPLTGTLETGKRRTRALLLLALFLVGGVSVLPEIRAVATFLTAVGVSGNLREVLPQRLYRSSAVSAGLIKDAIFEHHIKTVLDLRTGRSVVLRPFEPFVTEGGARYVHVPITTTHTPDSDSAAELRAAIVEAEPPLLVLCHSGSDRTGVAAALWLSLREGWSAERSAEQLSLEYGYVELVTLFREWRSGHEVLARLVRPRSEWGSSLLELFNFADPLRTVEINPDFGH
jgi:hypothetical protein